jgi:hypothetical protein
MSAASAQLTTRNEVERLLAQIRRNQKIVETEKRERP